MESIKIILLCIVSAIFYGILHDQVTARICVEYFTIGHPPIFNTDSPTLLAFGWGTIATWWVGAILGLPAAGMARIGRMPKISAHQLVRPIGCLLMVTAFASLGAGIFGYVSARSGGIWLLDPLASRVPQEKHAAFLADLWAHRTAYGFGFVGGLVLCGWIWWRRVQMMKNENAQKADTTIPARCDVCGLESSLADAYHRVQITRRWAKVYCPSCWQKRTTARYRIYLICVGLAGLIGLLIYGVNAEQPFSPILLAICLFVVFDVLCILPHELGHALAALLVGMRLFTVCIGSLGRVLFSVRLFGYDFVFRSIPVGGHTLVTPRSLRFARLRYFVVLLCGPLVNCALIGAALVIWQRSSHTNFGSLVLSTFILSNLVVLAVNLWPWKGWHGTGRVSTDGLALLKLPFKSNDEIRKWHASYFYLEGLESRERKKPDEAMRWFLKGLKEYPNEWVNNLGLGILLLDLARYREARDAFWRTLEQAPLTPEFEATIWNNIAWADVMSGSLELRGEADRLSQQACERMPWIPAFKGTRGSVLVDCGHIDQGLDLLKEAFVGNELASHKALNACYMALATARKGNVVEAQQHLRDARRLNSECPLIQRVVRELDAVATAPDGT